MPGDAAWIDMPSLSVGRDSCASSIGPDGRIYVLGGRVAVGIERAQKARLVGVDIGLHALQHVLADEKRCFNSAIVSPKPHGTPRAVVETTVIWKLNHSNLPAAARYPALASIRCASERSTEPIDTISVARPVSAGILIMVATRRNAANDSPSIISSSVMTS